MDNGGVLLEAEKEYQRKYKRSRWWIEHRDGLRRLALAAFAAVDALLVGFAGWTFLDAYALSYDAETRAVLQLAAYGQADLRAYSSATAADPLEAGSALALASVPGAFDLYARVQNPNEAWWAEFEYAFVSGGEEIARGTGFALPGDETAAVVYAVKAPAAPRGLSFELGPVTWHRVDPHETGDYARWIEDRLAVRADDPRFDPAGTDGSDVARVRFTATNDSAYGYYEPAFLVTLLRGSSVVGVTRAALGSLDAGESREVSVTWPGAPQSATKVEVSVVINPFELASYKPLRGETPEDIRVRVMGER